MEILLRMAGVKLVNTVGDCEIDRFDRSLSSETLLENTENS